MISDQGFQHPPADWQRISVLSISDEVFAQHKLAQPQTRQTLPRQGHEKVSEFAERK
jgi:hypothetical protein